ncbi:unnamed protein product [Mytilus edulis]|uniref:Endonuclease/exonuclease/phosphatase domain-containing protein n=1 Tax=Mytilus edulis TaxID=6550 RepID=A0A8S3RAC9_MYTED|nr:unnamed protein product [Mytilus edulis]
MFSSIDSISISSWNVHGLGQKHRDPDFLELINHDINILIETWKGVEPDVQIPEYNYYCKQRTKANKAKRNSGGIIVYYKKKFEKGITYLKNVTKSQNRLWMKLDKSFFGLQDDLYICGIYIPPKNSPHYNNEYEGLESEISFLSSKGNFLLMGDFNSRVSNYSDFVANDENNINLTHILPDNYKSDFQLTRKSQDKIINPQGRDLLDLCVSAQLRILNGRFIGDLLGNMTFFSMKGCSVVDYAITSESLLSSVNYFIVKTPSYFSDHNQIVTHLKCDGKLPNINNSNKKIDFEFKWTNTSKLLLENELNEKYIYEELNNFQQTNFENTQDGLNRATDLISDIYITLSHKCMRKRYFKKKRKRISNWTDSNFFALRSTFNLYSKKLKLSPFDQSIRLKYFFYSKQLKTVSKLKKREFKLNVLNKLDNMSPNESKEFWKLLRTIKINKDKNDDNMLDLSQFADHFKNQCKPEKIDKNFEKSIFEELCKTEKLLTSKESDTPITISEIKTQIKRLKKE